jgi:hypothetical protein
LTAAKPEGHRRRKLLQPDERILAAISRLKSDLDFEIFEQWLKDSQLDKYRHLAGMEPDVQMRWLQGECQLLGRIITDITGSRDELDRIHRDTGHRPQN